MQRIIRFRFFVFSLIAACGLAFWNCNLSDPTGSTTLKLKVPDSLSVEYGYDSVLVNIYDGRGTQIYLQAFKGYIKATDSAKLANIQLANPVPDPMLVKIKAYKDTSITWELDITITDGKTTHRDTLHSDKEPNTDSIPRSINIGNPSPLILHVGAQPTLVTASVSPSQAPQTITWSLEAQGVAKIVNGNQIQGIKAGTARLIATSTAKTSITALREVVVDSVLVKPEGVILLIATPMTLAVGESDAPLVARIAPEGASQEILWTSDAPATVSITADSKARPLKTGKATLTGKAKEDSSVSISFEAKVIVPIKVDSISISPKAMPLYSGGEDGHVTVSMPTSDTAAHYGLTSSDPDIASVTADGTVKAWKSGKALITASVVGYPAIAAICTVTVSTDPPIPTVTPDQTITYGSEASFDVSVTQAYGTVAEIKADMDGDGIYEQNALGKNNAQFKAKYAQIKTFTISFLIRDGEGNIAKVERTVKVDPPPPPLVDIVDPAADITINQTSYKIRFTVKDPSLGIDTIKDSTVTNLADGGNLITASRTNIGGTGLDQVTITVNRNAPGVPVLIAQPQFTNDRSPTWAWGAVTGAVKYQVRLGDGDFTKTTGNIEKTDLSYTLPDSPDGDYTLYVRSLDALGNASSAASQTVTIDTKAPDTVSFVGKDNSYTDDDTPTWSWNPSPTNGGANSYQVILDGGAPTFVSTTSFTPASALSDNQTHTLAVRQKDQVDTVFGPARSFKYQVVKYAPAAPTVSGPAGLANNGRTNKLNFSWTGGARGIDTYRIKVNSEASYRETANTTRTFSLASNTLDGTYTIHVEELDALGRWGDQGTFTIILDRTGPNLSFVTRNNYITNTSPAKVEYKVDGVSATAVNCALTKSNQANTCPVSAADDLGNTSQASITVYYRPNTYFVSSTGIGNGSSWENASSDLGGFGSDMSRKWKEVWVASGTYRSGGGYQGIGFSDSMAILGGFDAAAFPTNPDNRSKSNTFVGGISVDAGFPQDPPRLNGTVDGFVFTGTVLVNNGCALTLVDSKFENTDPNAQYLIQLNNHSTLHANNLVIANRTFKGAALLVGFNCEAILNGGAITGNTITAPPGGTDWDAIAIFLDGNLKLTGGLSLYGNGNQTAGTGPQINLATDGIDVQIDSSVNMNCGGLLKGGGSGGVTVTGTCKGNPI